VQLPERLPNHSIQHKSKALIHVEQTTGCCDDVQRRSDNSRVELADVEHDQHFLVDEFACLCPRRKLVRRQRLEANASLADVDDLGRPSMIEHVRVINDDLLNAEANLLEAMCRFKRPKVVRGHRLERREIILLIAVIRMLVDYRIVLENISLHSRFLMNEIGWRSLQKYLYLLFGPTPVVIFSAVLAVSDRDDWVSIFFNEPVVVDSNAVSVLEAEWLIVPIQRMLAHKSSSELSVA
jgi:hypothetical protein